MALITCKLCRKIFTTPTVGEKRVCPDCHLRLDNLYMDVRNYLRDNPKEEFNVERLAEALGADIRDVQGLVDMGYLEREAPAEGEADDHPAVDEGLQKLAKEFEEARDKMRAAAAAAAEHKPVSYGQTLYGSQSKKR